MKVIRIFNRQKRFYGPLLTVCDKHYDELHTEQHCSSVKVPANVPIFNSTGWAMDEYPWAYELRDINVIRTIETLLNCIPLDECTLCTSDMHKPIKSEYNTQYKGVVCGTLQSPLQNVRQTVAQRK